jgi:hypothetical protein
LRPDCLFHCDGSSFNDDSTLGRTASALAILSNFQRQMSIAA